MPWRLTVRAGPRVEHSRFEDLGSALEAMEARGRELASGSSGEAVDARFKRFEPSQRVMGRIELAGPQRLRPSVRGGVDIRGDGSSEAYLGLIRRRVVEPRKGETAYAALRRVVDSAEGL